MGTYELNIIIHYNLDQKKKTKRKKQTNCEVRTKQTSSTETDHSLVMSNINKKNETCENITVLSF